MGVGVGWFLGYVAEDRTPCLWVGSPPTCSSPGYYGTAAYLFPKLVLDFFPLRLFPAALLAILIYYKARLLLLGKVWGERGLGLESAINESLKEGDNNVAFRFPYLPFLGFFLLCVFWKWNLVSKNTYSTQKEEHMSDNCFCRAIVLVEQFAVDPFVFPLCKSASQKLPREMTNVFQVLPKGMGCWFVGNSPPVLIVADVHRQAACVRSRWATASLSASAFEQVGQPLKCSDVRRPAT